jgi:hypothetical protein
MASDGATVSFFRYLAAGYEHAEQHRHVLDGFFDFRMRRIAKAQRFS